MRWQHSEPYYLRIQITYRMFTPLGANDKLLTLNFPIGTSARELDQNHVTIRQAFRRKYDVLTFTQNDSKYFFINSNYKFI